MRLGAIAEHTGAQLLGDDAAFTTLSTDTRTLAPGMLFVALRGSNFDGHHFAQQAVEKGAIGLVVDHPLRELAVPQLLYDDTLIGLGRIAAYKRQLFAGRVIAVTGSSGKTTVKGMLQSILAQSHRVVATHGNFNNQVGVPLTLMRLSDEDFAVVEVGTNRPGEIAYLATIVRPDVALVNNVAAAHLAGFGSLEKIAEEKASLYSALQSEATAVINLDDDYMNTMRRQIGDCRLVGFSRWQKNGAPALVTAEDVETDPWGRAAFALNVDGHRRRIELQVLGAHNIANALAAASCSVAVGVELDDIATGLGQYAGEPGRMQLCRAGEATLIDDSYNANPASVKAAIDYLSRVSGRRILVLGNLAELGACAEEIHRELGHYAAEKGIDALYACGDQATLAAQSFDGSSPVFDSKYHLIATLRTLNSAGDTLLVKGSRSSRMNEVVELLCRTGEQQ